jgi:NitT/TauT family transport system substrate-binding protein
MFKKIVLLTLGLALALSACGRPQSGNEAGTLVPIKLPLGYIPNIQFAPMYVMIEKGFAREQGLDVQLEHNVRETDAVALLGAGELTFAVVSGEQVLLSRAQGVPVVYVAAWYQKYPVSVVAKAEQGIKTVADLKGKTIGLPGLYGANYIGLEALLASAGLSDANVTLSSIGFTQVESLATDQVQAIVGYAANEPIQLRAQGYDVTELRVADFVNLASNGLVTNEKTLKENPELVRRMVKAFVQGLEYTIAHPDEAYEISKKYVEGLANLDESVQKEILAVSIESWQAERVGFSDMDAWKNMQSTLLIMSSYTEPVDLNAAFTNEFLP